MQGAADRTRGPIVTDAQVNELNVGHRPVIDSPRHADQLGVSGRRRVPRFERRGSGAQHERDAERHRTGMGNFASVIARLGVLFERGVVFFVDDDQAEAGQGGEHRAAGTDHDFHLAASDSLPLKVSLGWRHLAVQHRHAAKPAFESPPCLRRQTDLRDQHDRTAAETDGVFDGSNVDLRLAAARDAVQQQCGAGSRVECGDDLFQRDRLVVGQLVIPLGLAVIDLPPGRRRSRHLASDVNS